MPRDFTALSSDTAAELSLYMGEVIRRRRRELDMNQAELADCLNVAHQQIHKYETGFSRLSLDKLWHCSQALRLPIQAFFPSMGGADVAVSSAVIASLELPGTPGRVRRRLRRDARKASG